MDSNCYFALIDGKSIPAASPRAVAELVLRARRTGRISAYLVRGSSEQQEADGRELVEAWLRQLSESSREHSHAGL